ncbi:hypothetical protein IV203_019284 [Nitzschia inconspicua]|uniref:Uncharacterized protein n=1 Tax=Nitzschia inconspicua TaxID=303405 RepID=A0A9K3LY82_9STRA|nr:hypothetical protein IV203_019284 [Nitzschia inconspicua]
MAAKNASLPQIFIGDIANPNTRQGWLMILAAVLIVVQSGFLFASHRQSQHGAALLRKDILEFQKQQQQAVEVSKDTLLMLYNKEQNASVDELSSLLMVGGGGILAAQDQLSISRLQELLQTELLPLYQRQDTTTERIQEALQQNSRDIQKLAALQSTSTVEDTLRQQEQMDRLVPIIIAVLIMVGGWIMERRLKNDWKDTLEMLKDQERKFKAELVESQQTNAQLQRENENLKQLLETSRESIPYSLFEKLQTLENGARERENDYQQIKSENVRLKEYADSKGWEKELKRLQTENQQLREFSGPSELADMRREYAKVKSELKEMELNNIKLSGELKRLKLDKDKKTKVKQRWSFKSL